jgi:hypothetical protein
LAGSGLIGGITIVAIWRVVRRWAVTVWGSIVWRCRRRSKQAERETASDRCSAAIIAPAIITTAIIATVVVPTTIVAHIDYMV